MKTDIARCSRGPLYSKLKLICLLLRFNFIMRFLLKENPINRLIYKVQSRIVKSRKFTERERTKPRIRDNINSAAVQYSFFYFHCLARYMFLVEIIPRGFVKRRREGLKRENWRSWRWKASGLTTQQILSRTVDGKSKQYVCVRIDVQAKSSGNRNRRGKSSGGRRWRRVVK